MCAVIFYGLPTNCDTYHQTHKKWWQKYRHFQSDLQNLQGPYQKKLQKKDSKEILFFFFFEAVILQICDKIWQILQDYVCKWNNWYTYFKVCTLIQIAASLFKCFQPIVVVLSISYLYAYKHHLRKDKEKQIKA